MLVKTGYVEVSGSTNNIVFSIATSGRAKMDCGADREHVC